jgi:hypothetical protein
VPYQANALALQPLETFRRKHIKSCSQGWIPVCGNPGWEEIQTTTEEHAGFKTSIH